MSNLEIQEYNYINTLKKECKDWTIYTRKLGNYFGYPECCIEQFITNCTTNNLHLNKFNLNGVNRSGFCPCNKHREQITRGEVTLSSIILDTRQSPLPFEEMWSSFEKMWSLF